MTVELEKILFKDWKSMSEFAHAAVFGDHKPVEFDRIDYVIIARNEKDEIIGYTSVRELSHNTVYWQFGGIFPKFRGTSDTMLSYMKLVAWTKERYEKVSTLIKNGNVKMLKMALQVGFKPIGVKCVNGNILVDMLLEFNKGEENDANS